MEEKRYCWCCANEIEGDKYVMVSGYGEHPYCFECKAELDTSIMATYGDFRLYLSEDGKTVHNNHRGLVIPCFTARRRNGASDVWFDFDGRLWHGVSRPECEAHYRRTRYASVGRAKVETMALPFEISVVRV